MVIHDKKKYVIHENVTNDFTFKLTLVLIQIRKKDYGTYKCISKNSIGESEGTIKIHGTSAHHTLAAFFDSTKAPLSGVSQGHIRGRLITYILQFLSSRRIQVRSISCTAAL